MSSDPIERLRAARTLAREAGDGNAMLCTLAINTQARPSMRTLVLRDFDDGYAVYINTSSNKWREAEVTGGAATVMVWLPSQQSQFRLDVTLEVIDKARIDKEWHNRPPTPKRLDHLYASEPQGAAVSSREALLAKIEGIPSEGLQPPAGAQGWSLRVLSAEILVLDDLTRVHDRRAYTLSGDQWQEQILIP